MKRYLLLGLLALMTLGLSSCDLDGNDPNFHFEAVEITNAILPDTLSMDNIYEFDISFSLPTNCHFFDSFDYLHTGDLERTVTAFSMVIESDDCDTSASREFTRSLGPFKAERPGTYLFKFFTGEDENGEPQFLEIEALVQE